MSTSLITPEDVRVRLNLPDDGVVSDIIDASIKGATPFVESVLRTKFTPGEGVDTFYLTRLSLAYADTHALLLDNGFVSDVVVKSGGAMDSLNETITPIRIDSEKGIVWVPTLSLEYAPSRWVYLGVGYPAYYQISYSYGLDKDSAPDWLKEVLVAKTVQLMSTQQLTETKPHLNQIFQLVKDHGTELLDRHLRRDSFAIRSR